MQKLSFLFIFRIFTSAQVSMLEMWFQLKCFQTGIALDDLLCFFVATSIYNNKDFLVPFRETFSKKRSCNINTTYH